MEIEHKAHATNFDVKNALDEFLNAFEHYKDTNDERLHQIETKAASDPLLEDKLTRIDQALDIQKKHLDRLYISSKQPGIGEIERPVSDHKSAFDHYVRSGDASRLNEIDYKNLSSASDPEGGYIAPLETEQMITSAIKHVSPVRQVASVRQIGGSIFRKPVAITGAASGWVGETAARPQTAAPSLAAVDFPTKELYAMPATTQALLDDSIIDVEQWLADEVQAEFAIQEGKAFVTGDGVSSPKGLLAYNMVKESTYSWGNVGYIGTGAKGSLKADNPETSIIDMVYTLKQGYRANGRFLLNKSVVSELRKIKDKDGHYLWQPSSQAGVDSTFLGYPVIESEDMPDISIDSLSILFGDFGRGYLIVDRVGVRVLRDPFSAKPYVLFYITKRVGGGIQDFDAIKALKFSV